MDPAGAESFHRGKYRAIMFFLENSSTRKKERVDETIAAIMIRENMNTAGLAGNSMK